MVEQEKTLMTQGPIGRILLRFALPLFLGNLFQQLYNTVDSLVVGNFSGNEALAAVSSSGSLCFLIIGFFQGVFAGASVVISRRYGARDGEGVDRAVHATVIFSLAAGLLLTVLGVGFTPAILRWIGTPENVMPDSVLYFRIYCSGLLGLVLYNTANGIFPALGDSRHPLYYLIVSSVVNVVLDLLFVAVWDMGVAGAALATVIGQCLSALLGWLFTSNERAFSCPRLSSASPGRSHRAGPHLSPGPAQRCAKQRHRHRQRGGAVPHQRLWGQRHGRMRELF